MRNPGTSVTRAAVAGPVNATTAGSVLAGLLAGITRGTVLVVDLSEVDALDAVGVGVLRAVGHHARSHGGDLRLTQVPAWIAAALHEAAAPAETG